ncbi:MAG: hypothetical protein Q2306_02390 [Phytoplasma sp.]|uniref:hypothetical protein n=1 Tax=Phytoplasma sp. TaxID=2155 RepID=UPI002B4177A6|nr:hypothetical protein [Phytoplasma sp.]WRH06718.1 MAG: hypothetical protein Q2306_02390 [Phytoplasma sp.]
MKKPKLLSNIEEKEFVIKKINKEFNKDFQFKDIHDFFSDVRNFRRRNRFRKRKEIQKNKRKIIFQKLRRLKSKKLF